MNVLGLPAMSFSLKVNSESQHTESVKKILCADSYAKKGNGKKAEKGIREKDYSKARNYDTLFASWTTPEKGKGIPFA